MNIHQHFISIEFRTASLTNISLPNLTLPIWLHLGKQKAPEKVLGRFRVAFEFMTNCADLVRWIKAPSATFTHAGIGGDWDRSRSIR